MTERAMQEPTRLLLTALADAPRHGYALIQEISVISGGRVTMRAGTLYAALDRLLDQGLIHVDRDEVVDGRARRTYALSEPGRTLLAEETERLRVLVAEAERRLSVVRPITRGAFA
ncbi:PadR family transcriptional regulator [Kitasatospora sp. NPDC008050]|uniref:PadR family transcriptional regulator n=1 Tax=Kitasatospora sp. NPDC008050 TaxID=3364021 RepID=UPI0036E932D0